MSSQRSFQIFASLLVAVVGLSLISSGCSSEQVSQKEKEKGSETKKQEAEAAKPQHEAAKDNTVKDEATKQEPASSDNDTKARPSAGDAPEKTAGNEDGKFDAPPETPKRSDDTQSTDPPTETKPKDAPKNAGNGSAPPAGDKPEGPGEEPAEENLEKLDNPFAPAADLDADGLVQFILDRINEREFIRRQSGFTDGVIEAADRIIASDASSGNNKSTALLVKFKVLYEASLAAEKGAEEKLFQLAEQQKDNTSGKASAFVRFVNMERRLLGAQRSETQMSETQSLALLDELKTYLAKEKLNDRQLRMAVLTVDLIHSLSKEKQQPLFEELGRLYAKSSHLDLKQFGQRLGKPPQVDIDRLVGKPLKLSGTTTSDDKFEWAAYRSDVVIVNFWTTWYGACVREIPRLRELYEKHAGDGLEIVGVSLDANRYRLKSFLSANGIPWVTISGKQAQQAAERYGVRSIPTLLLIGRDGKFIARSHRVEDLLKHLEAALAVKKEDVQAKADADAKAEAKAKADAKAGKKEAKKNE